MAGRRRSRTPEITIIYWADMPAQVTGTANGNKANALLAPRFQHAIDRAAAVAGKTDTELYVAEWRKVTVPLGPDEDLEEAVNSKAALLDETYPKERIEALVKSGGLDQETTSNTEDQQ